MKKLFFIILFLISLNAVSQTFPITQNIGSKPTDVHTAGIYSTNTGFKFFSFQDTTAANVPSYLSFTPGAVILVAYSQLWVRNAIANLWTQISGGGGGGGGFIYRDSVSAINIKSLAAIGDGTTDNATIFKKAAALAYATGLAVFIPAGTFYTSDSTMFNKVTVFGNGINSVIKFTSLSLPAAIVLQDSCEVYGLKIIGSGIGVIPGGVITSQNGIKINGGWNSVHNCEFTNQNGAAVGIWETSGGSTYSNRVINNTIRNTTLGVFMLINAEQNIVANNDIAYCIAGIWNRNSGNNKVDNNMITYCTDGYRSTGGGNADHVVITGNTLNHCTNSINIESADLGMIFLGDDLFSGNILIGSVGAANKVIIANCNLKDIVITGINTANSVVRDNNYLGTVTEAGSGILYVNNNNSTDAQYWRSNLNAIGATGTLGTSDNQDLSFYTNNAARVNILKSGEVGIGTAAAAGFKLFMVSAGNTDATDNFLDRNGDGLNIFRIQDGGTFSIGNPSVQTNTGTLYGDTKFINTKVGAVGDSILTKNPATGITRAVAQSSIVGAAPSLSSLTAATGTNSIDNGNNGQEWKWDALSNGRGLELSANTTAAATNTQMLLYTHLNGVNATINQTTYTHVTGNYHTGTGSVNVGGAFEASGGAANYAIIVPSGQGSVGIGTSTPTSTLQLVGSFAAAYVAKTGTYTLTASDYFVNATSGSWTATLPTAVGCAGRVYVIKNSGSATTITIATTSAQSIDGVSTKTLSVQYSGIQVTSDGANWAVTGVF